ATGGGHGRPATDMRSIVERSNLSDPVRRSSLEPMYRLIEAEPAVHGSASAALVLHDLGADDTLVDVCGSFALLHALGIDRVVCGPLPMGRVVYGGGVRAASAALA